jgi:hypothetical protein
MFKKLTSFAHVSLLLSITLSLPVLSQTGQTGQTGQTRQTRQKKEKGEKEQQPPPVAAKKTKAVNESCDGALNIVPTKSMTFARKRRPANSQAKQEPAPAKDRESKPVERRPGDGR